MDSRVLSLVSAKESLEPVSIVVERIKEALAMAEEGKLTSVAIVGVSDGDIVSCWANPDKPFLMVGAIESLKTDYIQANIE